MDPCQLSSDFHTYISGRDVTLQKSRAHVYADIRNKYISNTFYFYIVVSSTNNKRINKAWQSNIKVGKSEHTKN